MTTAIVLSGGGTKGAFEVGAVKYLYEQGVRPDILCGTSIGAINALKLAEGEQGLAGLENIWSSMRLTRDMYREQEWLYDDKMDGDVRRAITGKTGLGIDGPATVPGTEGVESTTETLPPGISQAWEWSIGLAVGVLNAIPGLAWLISEGKSLLESIQVLTSQADSLYNLGPVAAKLAHHIDVAAVNAWAKRGGQLRMAHAGLASGRLRWVTETGQVVERDGHTPVTTLVFPPGCEKFKHQLDILFHQQQSLLRALLGASASERQHLQDELRQLDRDVAETSEDLRKCRQRLNNSEVREVPVEVDVRDGALASASIPAMFLPVPLQDDWAVDGGVREGLPLQMAVNLGADTIYAVRVTGRVTPTAYVRPKLAGTALRSISLMLDEVNHGDTVALGEGLNQAPDPTDIDTQVVSADDTETLAHPTRPAGKNTPARAGAPPARYQGPPLRLPKGVTGRMIEPDVLLYGTAVLDPGLIKINKDYGYMRAADVLDDAGDAQWTTSTQIALLRRKTWALEIRRHGKPDPRIAAQVDTSPDNHRIHPALDAAAALGLLSVPTGPLLRELLKKSSDPWATLRDFLRELNRLDNARKDYAIPPDPDPALQADINRLKGQLAELIAERRRLGGAVPDDIDQWTDLMELHPWSPPREGVAEGQVTLLRVHRELGFGPPRDHIDVHVVTQLDSEPELFLGFPLGGTGSDREVHDGWLNLLRPAFARGERVRIEYKREGAHNQLIRNVERIS